MILLIFIIINIIIIIIMQFIEPRHARKRKFQIVTFINDIKAYLLALENTANTNMTYTYRLFYNLYYEYNHLNDNNWVTFCE